MSQIEREMKERLEGRRDLLDKVKEKIEAEKEALQTLSIANDQKEWVTVTEMVTMIAGWELPDTLNPG